MITTKLDTMKNSDFSRILYFFAAILEEQFLLVSRVVTSQHKAGVVKGSNEILLKTRGQIYEALLS